MSFPRRQRGQAVSVEPALTDEDLSRLRLYKARYAIEVLFQEDVTPQLVGRLVFAKWLRMRGALPS